MRGKPNSKVAQKALDLPRVILHAHLVPGCRHFAPIAHKLRRQVLLVHIFPGYVLVKEIPIKGHFEDVTGESVDVGEFPSLDGRILPKKNDLKV